MRVVISSMAWIAITQMILKYIFFETRFRILQYHQSEKYVKSACFLQKKIRDFFFLFFNSNTSNNQPRHKILPVAKLV